MTTHITFTGIYGDMRRRGREYVERLKAVYDGCLVLGVTTHVVCDPTRIAGSAPSEKLLLAVEAGLPVLSFRWLEKCAQAGRWIPLEGYTVALRAMQPASEEAVLAPEEGSTGVDERTNENRFATPPRFNSTDLVRKDNDAAFGKNGGKIIKGYSSCNLEKVLNDVSFSTVQHHEASSLPTFEEENYVALQHGMQRENKSIKIKIDNEIENKRRLKPEFECLSATATASATAGSPSSTALHLPSSGTCVDSSRLGAVLPPAAPLSPSAAAVVFQPSVIVEAGPLVKADERWLSRKLRGIEAHHGVSLRAEQVKFYATATVDSSSDKGQRKISIKSFLFQGVNLLYDIDRVSSKTTYARALVTSIYSLETGAPRNELWMEHHYLFGKADFQERPDWKLPQGPPRDGELLMSTGIYHSPLNLVVGDFGIIFTNINGPKDKKYVGEPWKLDFFPVYLCRKAFDVSARKCIPLKKAILDSDINFPS